MKTYYDILEVSRYASLEVIKRAHKVLVKRYHPDLQSPEELKKMEEEMIKINEAYETLIDPVKREKYDKFLEQQEALNKSKSEEGNSTYNEQNAKKVEVELANKKLEEEVSKRIDEAQKDIDKQKEKIQEQMNEEYIKYLRNLGYKGEVKSNKPAKEKLKSIGIKIAIFLVLFIIATIIYRVPVIYEKVCVIEEKNLGFKILSKIIGSVVNAIWSIFGV